MDTEADTRRQIIDRQLAERGWVFGENMRAELPLRGVAETAAPYSARAAFADYCLYDSDGTPIAVVEAKRSSRDPRVGERQARGYADLLLAEYGFDPFIFLTNGERVWFLDRQRYPLREVRDFFAPEDLRRLAFQRTRKPLADLPIDPAIVNRDYQHGAIRSVTESLAQAQRTFLLVMATGTGKTRTTIALVELLMRAGWVQHVLFLADRRELVKQALDAFKEHLPNETRSRIEGADFDTTARIHVATYPSMMQGYTHLSPAFYDLIVADESHRSIYNTYRALFDYFDAITLGLTATPVELVDRNTFDLFHCPDGLPTFHYGYNAAIEEETLVPYRVFEAQTAFQIEGIRGDELPPEAQQQIIAQGVEPGDVAFDGTELERQVTNSGTHDALVEEFMRVCRKDSFGSLPAKAIIFAVSHRHALALYASFNRLYPDLQRRGMAEVIDSQMERVEQALDDFKHRDMPRVAISVDMLDTGIDVPGIQTLVFAKPIYSRVKFWQMIGRGTRLWTNPETGEVKTSFLIIDHWRNFQRFDLKPEGETASQSDALAVRLFRARVDNYRQLRAMGDPAQSDAWQRACTMVADLPADNREVQRHKDDRAALAGHEAWGDADLVERVAALMRYLPTPDRPALVFALHTEQLVLAHLTNDVRRLADLKTDILDDIAALPLSLYAVQQHQALIEEVKRRDYWQNLSYSGMMRLQQTFAPLMRYRQQRTTPMIELHLPDTVALRRWIVYGPAQEGAYAERYQAEVEARVRELAESLPALRKLRQGAVLDEADVRELADALARPDLYISERVLQDLYERPTAHLLDFMRHILGLSALPRREDALRAEFDAFVAAHPHFSAAQITFVRAVRAAVIRRARLTTADLERPPFSRIGSPHDLFAPDDVRDLLDFANRLVG